MLTGLRVIGLLATVGAILVIVVDRVRETRRLAKFEVSSKFKCPLREQVLQVPQSKRLWTAVAVTVCVLASIIMSSRVISGFISNDAPTFTCNAVERSRNSVILASVILVD